MEKDCIELERTMVKV